MIRMKMIFDLITLICLVIVITTLLIGLRK